MLSPLIKTFIWPNLEAQAGAGLHPTLSTGITCGKALIFHLYTADFPWFYLCLSSYFCVYSYLTSVYLLNAPSCLSCGLCWHIPAPLLCPAGQCCSCLQPGTGMVLHRGSVEPELNIHRLARREPQNMADFRGKRKKIAHFSLGLFLL